MLGVALGAPSDNSSQHASIRITQDGDFTAANGLIGGSGTAADPYILGDLQFKDLSPGYGLMVDNTGGGIHSFFQITRVHSTFTVVPDTGASLVWVVNVHQATEISNIESNPGEAPGSIGIRVDDSSWITLTHESIDKMGSDGIQVNHSDHVTIAMNKIKAHGNGVAIHDSHDVLVDRNTFTYDDKKGLLVDNSYNVHVEHTVTAADDSGGIFVTGTNSYGVLIANGTASANGPICPAEGPTSPPWDNIGGITVGNGAHDIAVHGYTMQANGDGAGGYFDIMNGGNGLWLNPCDKSVTSVPLTLPGGANLDFSGNCFHNQFGFDPAVVATCGPW